MAPNSKRSWKKRKRKQKPVTEQSLTIKKIKKNKKLISAVHVLNQEIDKVKGDSSLTAYEVKAKCQRLQEKIEALGGLGAYQLASKKGESRHGNFNSAQWVLKAIKEHSGFEKGIKLELLDVGAVSLNYEKQKKWIKCTSIDLVPQQTGILPQDFFEFKLSESEVYHVIVLSLVLNFVGTSDKRGLMLHHCSRLCKHGGYLFIVLPLPCLKNSRYLDDQLLNSILENVGFKEIKTHNSKKLSFKMFQKEGFINKHGEFRLLTMHFINRQYQRHCKESLCEKDTKDGMETTIFIGWVLILL
ncbi:25S rRNA (adenine(2142)-N(1))-methyltransferase [Holothuria leucospilota]|uniref:S-adenosylmethionine sensor upstream of mTORC1 n=1 Tax=Holothuria leucospilota TaxID=206669 RepID=A0A9Q1BIF9_HOLLE|nr:25S rRNA (adenine(2142)-N(1))-methyltransferase [Holothuria leucospilota]